MKRGRADADQQVKLRRRYDSSITCVIIKVALGSNAQTLVYILKLKYLDPNVLSSVCPLKLIQLKWSFYTNTSSI